MGIGVSVRKENNFTLTFKFNDINDTQKYFHYLVAMAEESKFKVNINSLDRHARYFYPKGTFKFPLSLITNQNNPSNTMAFMLTPNAEKCEHVNAIFKSVAAKQQTDFILDLSGHENFFHILYEQPWVKLLEDKQIITTIENKLRFNLSQFPDEPLESEIYLPEVDWYETLREMICNNLEEVYKNDIEKLNKDLLALAKKLPMSIVVEHGYDHDLVMNLGKQLFAIVDTFTNMSNESLSIMRTAIKSLNAAVYHHFQINEEQKIEVTRLFNTVVNQTSRLQEFKQKVERKKIGEHRSVFAGLNPARPAVMPNPANNNNNRGSNSSSYN